MKGFNWVGIFVFSAAIGCTAVSAQSPAAPDSTLQRSQAPPPPAANGAAGPVDLNWAPPALAQLSAEAASRSSFSLDRTTLGIAAGLVPESEPETRQAIAKIDGVSVHILRFGPAGISDEPAVNGIRQAYHLRGWKHLVTNTALLPASTNAKGPLNNGTTDLWLVMDGVNVRGAAALVESPRSLTLITLAGNISPVDMLHLRGHFGIPRFDGDQFKDAKDR
jgi:hypothetical protein